MADTPFGLSFGNPSMYMGKSPLAEIGKALKTGLMVGAVEKSGLRSYLDGLGVKANKDGKFGFEMPKAAPAGAVPPIANGIQGTSPAFQGGFGGPVAPPQASAQAMQPAAPPSDPAGVVVTPIPEVNLAPPPDAGSKILDGTFQPQSVDLTNKTDFNPAFQQTGYNQMLNTGNEYQQMPGYGKLKKAFEKFGGTA